MRGSRAATALLAGVATALALLAAEVVLRLARPFVSDKPSEFLVPHPVLGWARPPGARFHFVIDGDAHTVAYDARGFRDAARDPVAGAGDDAAFRIVVLGDSFMEAYSVPLEAAFSRRLEARLRGGESGGDGGGVEVVNLGVSGYGTLQELLVYQLEGRAHAPSLVLLGFYLHNDLRDNSLEIETLRRPDSEKATDRPFLLPGDGWQLTGVEADSSFARYRAALARRRSWWWRAGEVSQLWRLTGAAWIDSALRALADARDPDRGAGAGAADPLPRPERIALELDVFSCRPRPEYDRAWDLTARIFERLAAEVRADGAQLVVFDVPSVYESLPEAPDEGAGDLSCRDAPPGYARLREILAGLGVPFIDLVPAFQRHARDLEVPLFAGDSHWNAAGHALAADEVARGLSAKGLVSSGRRSAPASPGGSR